MIELFNRCIVQITDLGKSIDKIQIKIVKIYGINFGKIMLEIQKFDRIFNQKLCKQSINSNNIKIHELITKIFQNLHLFKYMQNEALKNEMLDLQI